MMHCEICGEIESVCTCENPFLDDSLKKEFEQFDSDSSKDDDGKNLPNG